MKNQNPPINLYYINGKKNVAIDFDYDKQTVSFIRDHIPTASWDKVGKVWLTPGKTVHIVDLIEKFTKFGYKLTVHGDIQKEYEKHEVYLEESRKNSERLNEIKNDFTYNEIDFNFLKMQPRPYQKAGFAFCIKTNGNCIIGDEPGLGKTLQAISYCTYNRYRTLVICPASLTWVWEAEINKFTNDDSKIIVNGTQLDSSDKQNYLIASYKFFISKPKKGQKGKTTLEQLLARVDKGKIDCIVIDEAHNIKSLSAKTTKAIHKYFKDVPHKLLLSGTPIKNRPIEYFSLLKFIDKKRWSNKIEFGVRYCNAKKTRWGLDLSGASNLQELYRETAPYIIRREKTNVLSELPDKMPPINIPIHLTPAELKHYSALEDDVTAVLDSDEEVLDSLMEGSKSGNEEAYIIDQEIEQSLPDSSRNDDFIDKKKKLMCLSKIHKVKMFTSSIKVKYAQEIIDNIIDSGKKIVVFSQYLHVIHELQEHYKNKCVILTGAQNTNQRKEAVTKFQNDDDVKIFIGSIMAAGVGLTLTAASNSLFVDEPWTPGDKIQAEDRIHRIGQKDVVNIYTLICTDTIDEHINKLLSEKRDVLAQVLDNRRDEIVEKMNILDDVIKMFSKRRKKKK